MFSYALYKWFYGFLQYWKLTVFYTWNGIIFCILSASPRRFQLLSINRIVELLESLRVNQFMRKVFNYIFPCSFESWLYKGSAKTINAYRAYQQLNNTLRAKLAKLAKLATLGVDDPIVHCLDTWGVWVHPSKYRRPRRGTCCALQRIEPTTVWPEDAMYILSPVYMVE